MDKVRPILERLPGGMETLERVSSLAAANEASDPVRGAG